MAGGIVEKGGSTDHVMLLPSATMIRGAPYEILCYDASRRADGEGEESSAPPVRAVPLEEYEGGCEEVGESSTFFLFNLFPVTPRLDMEYAMAVAIQKLEGDSMVNIRAWHETHYYSLLGRVSVLKVKGDVIRFLPAGTKGGRR